MFCLHYGPVSKAFNCHNFLYFSNQNFEFSCELSDEATGNLPIFIFVFYLEQYCMYFTNRVLSPVFIYKLTSSYVTTVIFHPFRKNRFFQELESLNFELWELKQLKVRIDFSRIKFLSKIFRYLIRLFFQFRVIG